MDEGVKYDVFKLVYITPLNKGGSSVNPVNNRCVRLTMHVIKIFERVIKNTQSIS